MVKSETQPIQIHFSRHLLSKHKHTLADNMDDQEMLRDDFPLLTDSERELVMDHSPLAPSSPVAPSQHIAPSAPVVPSVPVGQNAPALSYLPPAGSGYVVPRNVPGMPYQTPQQRVQAARDAAAAREKLRTGGIIPTHSANVMGRGSAPSQARSVPINDIPIPIGTLMAQTAAFSQASQTPTPANSANQTRFERMIAARNAGYRGRLPPDNMNRSQPGRGRGQSSVAGDHPFFGPPRPPGLANSNASTSLEAVIASMNAGLNADVGFQIPISRTAPVGHSVDTYDTSGAILPLAATGSIMARYPIESSSRNLCQEMTAEFQLCNLGGTYPCEEQHAGPHYICHMCKLTPETYDILAEDELIKQFRLYLCIECTEMRSKGPDVQLWEHPRRQKGETRTRRVGTCTCHDELQGKWHCVNHRRNKATDKEIWGQEKVKSFRIFFGGNVCASCREKPPHTEGGTVMWNCAACEDLVILQDKNLKRKPSQKGNKTKNPTMQSSKEPAVGDKTDKPTTQPAKKPAENEAILISSGMLKAPLH